MTTRALLAFLFIAVLSDPVVAQHSGPYAGFEQRPIKSLSAQQIEDLRRGRGMGLALNRTSPSDSHH
jgi:hypothetical protein